MMIEWGRWREKGKGQDIEETNLGSISSSPVGGFMISGNIIIM